MEVKPYVLLDLFLMIWVLQELIYRRAIDAFVDHTAELSMKAPMSVSKPADLEIGRAHV